MNHDAAPITRALSVRQPYAELILRGKKRFEYRGRTTHVRERVYLYASKTPADDPKAWREVGVPVGGLVTERLVGTVVITGSKERASHGDFAWSLSDPKRLDPPLRVTNQPQPGIWRPRIQVPKVEKRPFTPPEEPFAHLGRSPRSGGGATRGRPLTGELVCYHNPDTMGREVWKIDRPVTAVSAREYVGATGQRLWFVTGRGRPRRYFLAGWMRIASVEEEGRGSIDLIYRSAEAEVATSERALVEITNRSWFKALQRACANFAGLQHVTDLSLLAELEAAWKVRR